jgi:hypothetical protein
MTDNQKPFAVKIAGVDETWMLRGRGYVDVAIQVTRNPEQYCLDRATVNGITRVQNLNTGTERYFHLRENIGCFLLVSIDHAASRLLKEKGKLDVR